MSDAMSVVSIFRSARLWAICLMAIALAACISKPKLAPPVPLASTGPTLERFMSDAERAHQEGARTVERDTYRKAAQAYPTSKEPWLKLAESYFEAADYGSAILSAQEVLHRDSADKVATSLLAVSGLRVSATALSSMRQQQDMSADTRRQAEDVVKALREALGEKALVPQVAEAASTPVSPPKRFFTRRAATVAAAAAAASAPSMSAAAPAPAMPTTVSKKSANPFDALK